MIWNSRILGAAAVAVAFIAVPSVAQNYALNPTYGTYNLQSGFLPDPYNISVVAGGPNNVSAMTNGQCAGFAAEAPDVRVFFQGGNFSQINFSAMSNADTTLIVNDPNGTWWCDDDSGNGLNPLLALTPISGQYDIWVGTFGSNTAQATLAISELPYNHAQSAPPAQPAGPNYALTPTYGSYNLQSGFLPDPYQIQVVAGGNSNVSAMTNGQCAGYAASAPDVRVFFQGGNFSQINFSALSNADTTLIINDPNGTWWCDDDSGNGLNPLLTLTPLSGQYDIWVGTFGSNTAAATLAISELPYNSPPVSASPPPPPPPAAVGPDYSLAPTYGTYSLQSGFTPDPFDVPVVAGGNIDISNIASACRGFIASAPDVRVHFTGGYFNELYFSVDSGADTTLVINDPNGNWHCDDDGGNGPLNPSLTMTPVSGQYDIWVGTYGSSTANATLTISELYSR